MKVSSDNGPFLEIVATILSNNASVLQRPMGCHSGNLDASFGAVDKVLQ